MIHELIIPQTLRQNYFNLDRRSRELCPNTFIQDSKKLRPNAKTRACEAESGIAWGFAISTGQFAVHWIEKQRHTSWILIRCYSWCVRVRQCSPQLYGYLCPHFTITSGQGLVHLTSLQLLSYNFIDFSAALEFLSFRAAVQLVASFSACIFQFFTFRLNTMLSASKQKFNFGQRFKGD